MSTIEDIIKSYEPSIECPERVKIEASNLFSQYSGSQDTSLVLYSLK